MHVRLPGVQSVHPQLALVNECYEDEKIDTLALVRIRILVLRISRSFRYKKTLLRR